MTNDARSQNNRRLAAVVVTHNRLPQLKTTVAQLLSHGSDALETLVIVDNASKPATAEWLAQLDDPRVDVLRLDQNSGGAGGFAAGLHRAFEMHSPDWVVVMDDDARPTPGALDVFQTQDITGWDALSAAVYYPDGEICEMNRPSRNPFWRPRLFAKTLAGVFRGRVRQSYHLDDSAFDAPAPVEIDLTSFVGLFLSRGVLEKVGYPDANLFLYGDDVIYTLRMRLAGMTIALDPQIRFEHDCSTFVSEGHRVFKPIWKVYYLYRNGLIMYRKASGPILFWFLVLLLAPKWYLSARRYGEDRALYLKIMKRALRDGVTQNTSLSHANVLAMAERPPA